MFINRLKKLWIKLFLSNPYRIRTFEELYAEPVGSPVDIPESLSFILKHEAGETAYYPEVNKGNGDAALQHDAKRYKNEGLFKTPDRYVYSISNGCVFGQTGLIYDPDKRSFINESAREWTIDLYDSPYTNAINLPPKQFLKGIVLSFLTIGADAGFYHFLFESLPKLELYKTMAGHAAHFLFNGPAEEWKINWLKQAGIDINKIIWVGNNDHYQCHQLLFTNRLIADQQMSRWCAGTLKKWLSVPVTNEQSKASPKVFLISRRDFIRNIAWEDDILQLYPFIERIDFSKLTPAEAIEKMAGATHVIGPHGAALSNVLFCGADTRVLEIFPHSKQYRPCYYRLCVACDLKYSVVCIDFKNKDNPQLGFNRLKETLDDFLADISSPS